MPSCDSSPMMIVYFIMSTGRSSPVLILLVALLVFAWGIVTTGTFYHHNRAIYAAEPVVIEKVLESYTTRESHSLSAAVSGEDPIAVLHLSPIKEHLECEDLYGTDLILHWREHSQELCEESPSQSHPQQLQGSITCHRATHVIPHSKFTPETCRFRNLIKTSDGWIASCPFDAKGLLKTHFAKRRANSGAEAVIKAMNLHGTTPANDASETDKQLPECHCVERRPTIMFMREKGRAANVFHEIAQLFALYVTKHVHGVGDNVDPAQVLLVAFDRQQRAMTSGFIGRCDELLSAFSNQSVLYAGDVVDNTCFSDAMIAFAGQESGFWHKFSDAPVPCFDSPIMKSFVSFLLRGIGIEPALAQPTIKMCWITRGQGYKRVLEGEQQFISRLQQNQTGILDVQVAEFGSGNLTSLRSQIEWSQQCSIMVGAHGAGLTHSLWMPTESVVVEILPPSFGSYRTLVRTMGHQYLYVPASEQFRVNWETVQDVVHAAVHLAANMFTRRDNVLSH